MKTTINKKYYDTLIISKYFRTPYLRQCDLTQDIYKEFGGKNFLTSSLGKKNCELLAKVVGEVNTETQTKSLGGKDLRGTKKYGLRRILYNSSYFILQEQ